MEKTLPSKILTSFVMFVFLFIAGCSSENPEELETHHLQRATAYQEQGQYKAAMIEYRNAVKKSGGAMESIIQYADMLNGLGHHAAALNLLEQAQGEKGEEYYLELTESYIGLNKYQSASDTLAELSVDSPSSVLLQAKVNAGKGDEVTAEKLFRSVLNSASATIEQKSESNLRIAMLQARRNQFDQASKTLQKIAQDDPSYPESQVVKAGIEIVTEDLAAAEATLSDVLSRLPNTDIIEPEKAVVLERLSYVLTRLGRSNEAYIYQKLLAEAFPGANEVSEKYQEAVKAFQSKDYAQAKASLQSILDDYPTHNKAKQLLGVISYLEGETLKASEYLDESVDPEVVDPLTRHVYAAASLKLNDPKRVLEILEPEIANTDSAKTLALYGLAAISDGQGSKGEKALLKAAEIEPENVRVRLALANYYTNTKPASLNRAYVQLDKAYTLAPGDRQVLADLVAYHYRQGGAKAAGDFVSKALKATPNSYGANLVAGYFFVSSKDYSQALEHFSKAVNAKSEVADYSEALFSKGRTEYTLEQFELAEKSLKSLVREYPEMEEGYKALYATIVKNQGESVAEDQLRRLAKRNAVVEPYLALINISLNKSDMDQAEVYYREAKSISPDKESLVGLERSIRYAKAVRALQLGEMGQARTLVSGLLAETPENIRLLSFLIDIEIRDGKLSEAEKVLGQLKGVDSGHPVVSILSGDLAVAKQDLSEARGFYEQAWEQSPGNVIADKLLAVLSLQKDESARQKLIESWQERLPASPKPILLQAIKYQERGQKTRAIESYRKVLELQSENVAALNNLGWLYYESGELSDSLSLLQRAAKLAPENPAVLDSLGWVLFKDNKPQEALPYLEKANQLAPGNEEIARPS